jgi:hypothetical protein
MELEEVSSIDRGGQILWMFTNVEMFRRAYFERKWKW